MVTPQVLDRQKLNATKRININNKTLKIVENKLDINNSENLLSKKKYRASERKADAIEKALAKEVSKFQTRKRSTESKNKIKNLEDKLAAAEDRTEELYQKYLNGIDNLNRQKYNLLRKIGDDKSRLEELNKITPTEKKLKTKIEKFPALTTYILEADKNKSFLDAFLCCGPNNPALLDVFAIVALTALLTGV